MKKHQHFLIQTKSLNDPDYYLCEGLHLDTDRSKAKVFLTEDQAHRFLDKNLSNRVLCSHPLLVCGYENH